MNNTTYSTGTISVGASSTAVTGVGTNWLTAGVRAGDALNCAGQLVIIASVNSATSITLKRPWAGAAQSGANYDILLLDDEVRSLVAANSLLQALGSGTLTSLGALAGAANQMPYWTGAGAMASTALTPAARTLLDDANVQTMRATLELTKVESPTDVTGGRVPTVGWLGLGGSSMSAPADFGVTDNSIIPGSYGISGAGPAGLPASFGNGHLTHLRRTSGGGEMQLAYSETLQALFMRGRGSGAWSNWARAISALDLVTSSADATVGRVLTVGYMGLGGTLPAAPADFSVVDNSLVPGIYRIVGTEVGRPAGVTYGVLHHTRRVGSGGETQMLIDEASGAIYTRGRATGAWTAWVSSLPESGSNANGYWVKFADGTLLMWGFTTTTATETSVVPLPLAAHSIGSYRVAATPYASSDVLTAAIPLVSNHTTTTFNLNCVNTSGTRVARSVSWVINARWK